MIKIQLVVGARPNYMKMAPLHEELSKYHDLFDVKLVHTGQHYDERMSKLFFNELNMPEPDVFLGVGSGSHGEQTSRIMERYEKVLIDDKPDLVMVAGDVNSTMACAIDAAKLHIPIAHVEAGLRSFDRRMPEEINRVVTDHLADYLLTPSPDAEINLVNEGIERGKIFFVGNIMIDSLIKFREIAIKTKIMEDLGLKTVSGKRKYCLVTLHRPSNVDDKKSLEMILQAFKVIGEKTCIVFPMHPRTRNNIISFNLQFLVESVPNLIITEPLGYLDFVNLECNADIVITDSGGIQEETTFLQIPCLTLRENTERPITVNEGSNQLVKLDTESIISAVQDGFSDKREKNCVPKFWDGHTSERIVNVLKRL